MNRTSGEEQQGTEKDSFSLRRCRSFPRLCPDTVLQVPRPVFSKIPNVRDGRSWNLRPNFQSRISQPCNNKHYFYLGMASGWTGFRRCAHPEALRSTPVAGSMSSSVRQNAEPSGICQVAGRTWDSGAAGDTTNSCAVRPSI